MRRRLFPLRRPLLGALLGVALAAGVLPGAHQSPAATAQQAGDDNQLDLFEHIEPGPHNNVVIIENHKDGRPRLRASVELERIPGDTAKPVNYAGAYASCTDCQTISLAFQIALRSRTATDVEPWNVAVAYNYQCTRCYTVARAIQYVVPVDDPREDPEDVKALLKAMEKELRDIISTDFTIADAEARINSVVAEFRQLGLSLYDQRQESSSP